ncbi:MAG: TetR/AcrR family transcriptional regulator [Albidovulum sp.]
MRNKRAAKKEDLRARLIDAAEAQIVEKGLSGLKAREVTEAAGCALGALYTAFDDIDQLILQVNSRTLARMGVALQEATVGGGTGPGDRLAALALGYVDFALGNLMLWKTVFNHRLPEGVMIPDWHREEHEVLIREIVGPLAQLRPDLGPEMLVQRAKTLFAAVHGVVHLALQGRFVGIARAELKPEVLALVALMVRGSRPED